MELNELGKTKSRMQREFEEEEEEMNARLKEEEEEKSRLKDFFVDCKGNEYDPDKKFGIIRDGN